MHRHRILASSLALGLVAAAGSSPLTAQAAAPCATSNLKVQGLRESVEVRRDHWGVNHIYAANEHDLFFAQGYAAAKDRLFQFELWRRQATGTLAEVLGPRALERDHGARLHLFRGDMEKELAYYHPRGKAIIEAFVDGVNAYIAETEQNPALLPIEFKMLDCKPGKWTPAVLISRHQGLLDNVEEEEMFIKALRVATPQTIRSLFYFQGGEPVLTPDAAIDPKAFPDNTLALYHAFRNPVYFTPEDVMPQYRGEGKGLKPVAMTLENTTGNFNKKDIGSNNWIISGGRTQSGFPILANDPHRLLSAPSLRYWVHLVAPGWNVIGGGEPVLPGVSIGHNEYGAWGLTIFGNDTEDLYVYDTNPANGNEYRYQGKWEPMRVIPDTIAVKGSASKKVELKYTRHGPVLFEDLKNHKAYALRAGWLEVGCSPYLSSLRMNQAKTWEEFREACTYNRLPSENMVWVDRKGNFGWQSAGLQPLRPNWSGLLPVPGDGRYEWKGYLPITSLPNELNPARGFIGTANHFLFPLNYPFPDAMHFMWAPPYRGARINEVLGSGRMFTVAATARLQNDDYSIPARELWPLLKDLSLSPTAAKAREQMVGWDYMLDKDSVPAAIQETFQRRLFFNMAMTLVPPALQKIRNFTDMMSMKYFIDLLYAPDARLGGPNPIAARDAILAKSFEEGVDYLHKKLGPNMANWKYGQEAFHHALIRHPMTGAVNAETRKMLDVGTAPRGGDSYTVSATGGFGNQFSGGTFKFITDAEDWDTAIGINAPGQSGDPASPHYRDLFSLWAQGKYFPVAYTRGKVEAVTEAVTTLVPDARK